MGCLLDGAAVDELELLIAPVALGAGTPLLGTDARPVDLRLLEHETWSGG